MTGLVNPLGEPIRSAPPTPGRAGARPLPSRQVKFRALLEQGMERMAQYRSMPGREGEPRALRRKLALAWAHNQRKKLQTPQHPEAA